jgi:SAM-dependent methyltransferase
LEFLSIAKKNHQITNSQRIHLCCADMNHLPLRKDSVDLVVSIATLHHTPGKLNRKQLMHDLSQILQENGFLLFSVWKRWQKKFFKYFLKDKIKRLFSSKYRKKQKRLGLHEFGDKLVPWTVSRKNKTYNRFYHLFTKRGTKELCKPFTIMEFEAMGGPTNKDNFFVLCQI